MNIDIEGNQSWSNSKNGSADQNRDYKSIFILFGEL